MKKLLALLIVIALLLGTMPIGQAWLEPSPWEDDFQYVTEGGILYFETETGTVTCYEIKNSSVQTLVIPSVISGVTVTTLDSNLFYYNTCLKSIILPETLITIKEAAFGTCAGLENITIPPSVETIKGRAFEGCAALQGIWVASENPYYASDEYGVLFDKSMTFLHSVPGGMSGTYTIADGVLVIGYAAFCRCKSLLSVNMPDSVIGLQNCAFEYCTALSEIRFSQNLEYMGAAAFEQTLLSEVELPESLHLRKSTGCLAMFPKRSITAKQSLGQWKTALPWALAAANSLPTQLVPEVRS